MSRISDRTTVQRCSQGRGRAFFIPLILFTLCLCDPSAFLHAPCPQNINLTIWSEEGYPSHGTWTVKTGGAAVVQSQNGPPTYFVSPYELINVRITGKITIGASAWDNDNIGFVFGYNAPIGVDSYMHDFLLFDWK